MTDHYLNPLFLAYQLEWSKSYARSRRWCEEVELLKEEMRRTLEFLKWKSSRWAAKALELNLSFSPALREGMSAYAFRQAVIFESLHDHFSSLWQGLRVLGSLPDQPVLISAQFEDEMQGVDGGDVDLG